MRRLAIPVAVVLVAAGGAVLAASASDGGAGPVGDDTVEETATTATAQVARKTLAETAEVNGVVSFGKAKALPIEAEGLVTDAPSVGDIVGPGAVVVRIAGQPVTVAPGSVPMYRTLRLVPSSERDEAGDKVGQLVGDDVLQLQNFLRFIGFDDDGDLEADGVFARSTRDAVKDWQASLGLVRTGQVDRTLMVFAQEPFRIESAPDVGEQFTPERLTVTASAELVTASVTARQRSFFEVGAEVTIPSDAGDVTGVVSRATRGAADDGSISFAVEITIEPGALPADVESVKVVASKVLADDVLTVPASALLALQEGGWAVEVVTPTGSELTAVELGEVVEGSAEVVGVDEGTEVVVAG